MAFPLITLTTDFGSSDHFVGALKGVLYSLAPEARVVDITHDIEPFEVAEAAFTVAEIYPYYPGGTVHVVVVDPGVGSARRPIAVAAGGQFFVAPDNGVLSLVLSREACVCYELTNPAFWRANVSQTFHGRDVFAPVAAHLANGVAIGEFGPVVEGAFRFAGAAPQRTGKRVWSGAVLKVDRFGNLITNFRSEELLTGQPFVLQVGLEVVGTLIASYAQLEIGEVGLIAGSAGYLEVVVNQGSAAKRLGVGPGAPVELTEIAAL